MKKISATLFFVFSILFLSSCSSFKSLEGNWETVKLIKDGKELPVIKSNMNFTGTKKEPVIKGHAGVNLFNCTIKLSGNSIKALSMENTGFRGVDENMAFEDLFFTVLMNASSYQIKNDILYLYAPSEKMEIQLKRAEKK